MKKNRMLALIALLAYSVFLTYGLLHPFHGWRLPQESLYELLFKQWQANIALFDVIQNILLYLPFGMICYYLQSKAKLINALWLFITVFVISFGFESLQALNPQRVPSILDVSLNALSGFIGFVMSPFIIQITKWQLQPFINTLKPIKIGQVLAIFCFAAFLIVQWYPFLPTLHPKQIWQGVEPLFNQGLQDIRVLRYITWGGMITISAHVLFKPVPVKLYFIVTMILVAKIFIVSRSVSFDALLGCLVGSILINGVITAQKAIRSSN